MRQNPNRTTARAPWRAALAGLLLAGGAAFGGLPAAAEGEGEAPPLPELSFTKTAHSGNEGNAITFVVQKNGAGEAAVDYATYHLSGNNLAEPGVDYTETSGSLYFFPDDTEKTITVQTLSDTRVERTESFGMRLSLATAGGDGSSSATAKLVRPYSVVGVILNCHDSC